MNVEKTASIVILALNSAGLVFLITVGIRKLLKRYMTRYETVEIEDDDLFLTAEDVVEPAPAEKPPEPRPKEPPAKKPEFNLDDFDFDL